MEISLGNAISVARKFADTSKRRDRHHLSILTISLDGSRLSRGHSRVSRMSNRHEIDHLTAIFHLGRGRR